MLSEENKKNFAKLTKGWTVKKSVSVVDSDDEWWVVCGFFKSKKEDKLFKKN